MILKKLFPVVTILFLFAFSNSLKAREILVKNKTNLKDAISNALSGDEIVLANGVWKDVEVEFAVNGTQEKPIILRAETPGKVFIEGLSFFDGGWMGR